MRRPARVPACVILCLAACHQPPRTAATLARRTTDAPTPQVFDAQAPREVQPPRATLAFCAYGGSGVLPPGVNPSDLYRAIAVVDLDPAEPSAPGPAFALRGVELLDEAGATLASMRSIDDVVRLERTDAGRDWSSYVDPPGEPVGDALPPGPARVRATVHLDHAPARPATRCRVTLRVGEHTVTAEGTTRGEWPTA